MILDIIKYPDDRLKQKSAEIYPDLISDPEIQKLAQDMKETMVKKDGIGLAGPQVNKLYQIIAVNVNNQPQIYINPKITKKSLRKNIMEEGCLSIPSMYSEVKRHNTIYLEYLDLDAKKHKIKTSGLFARVLQHEIDHLNGVLFIDRVRK